MIDDFLIVGAGSAGCVLANRLSEFANVTLLEAGPVNHWWDLRLHMPAALSMVLASRRYNWHFDTAPEPHLNNRVMYCPRGKVLGGSSAINGMIFVRGNPGDFDSWATEYDLPDWNYEACLPYFKTSETTHFETNATRGKEGPLQVTRGDSISPLNDAWLAAGQQAGHPFTTDFNGGDQEGVGYFDRTIAGGVRQSTARTYLEAAKLRQSLKIVTGTQVSRILFEGKRATGVEVIRSGSVQRHQSGTVILCGGAINSPQLLMLSGIGVAADLKAKDIEPRQELPGVGQNLQDHLEIYVQYQCKEPVSVYPATRWFNKPMVGLNWLLAKQGAAATNHFEAGAFLKSDSSKTYPDLQYHFLPIAMDYDGKDQYQGHGFQFHVGPMKPTSRGRVILNSNNPLHAPNIQFNYNATEEDRRVIRNGIRIGQEIVAQGSFDGLRGASLRPEHLDDSDDALDEFVRQYAESAYHPSGTCRMGQGNDAVVDPEANVHGMQSLKVIDASIMPEVTNGNLNAPVIMMAEKLADVIRDRD